MTGAEYIVEFLRQRGTKKIFLLTGGACAFIVDAIGKSKEVDYVCFQHEQAAAIAADAVWRISKTVGVTISTSGPGATNLLTGIACSFFDSIPALHITGQVNSVESAVYSGAKVRQAGFQETNIVEMVKPITKYAVKVNSIKELKQELAKAYNIAITARMGSVLVDVPMDVQKADAGDTIEYAPPLPDATPNNGVINAIEEKLENFFRHASRPAVLFGAGVGLAGVSSEVVKWIETNRLPFASSWNGMPYFNHDSPMYCGTIGVYGNRGANHILQNCDALLVLGNRLDNRQRSGNPKSFVSSAHVHVIDIDVEELKKYVPDGYATTQMNLKYLPLILKNVKVSPIGKEWLSYVDEIKAKYFRSNISTFSVKNNTLSPYEVVKRINRLIQGDAIVISDCGGSQCWVHQAFHRTTQTFFTSGGMAPMGYAVPAAIGAALTSPDKQVIAFTGDGGVQLNIQELHTIHHYGLSLKVVIMNNNGYGIIKQFQDSYFDSRYEASGRGYSNPDFQAIAQAYKMRYTRIQRIEELTSDIFDDLHPAVIDIVFHENTLIEPRLEMGHPINDQFPYVSDDEFNWANRFSAHKRVKKVSQ